MHSTADLYIQNKIFPTHRQVQSNPKLLRHQQLKNLHHHNLHRRPHLHNHSCHPLVHCPRGPRKPRILRYFLGFLKYFLDFGSNINVFNQNNLILELLRQIWCRIIMSFRQNTIFGPETCQIGPKVWNQTCPDLPRPVLLCKFIIFLWNHWFY